MIHRLLPWVKISKGFSTRSCNSDICKSVDTGVNGNQHLWCFALQSNWFGKCLDMCISAAALDALMIGNHKCFDSVHHFGQTSFRCRRQESDSIPLCLGLFRKGRSLDSKYDSYLISTKTGEASAIWGFKVNRHRQNVPCAFF